MVFSGAIKHLRTGALSWRPYRHTSNGGQMKKALITLVAAVTLTFGGIGVSATPFAPVQKAEAASYVSCYTAMNGERWCYRYACSAREEMAGCYNGWVRTNYWYA